MNGPLAYTFPPYRAIPSERRLLNQGMPVKLGGRAFDVLMSLIERRDRTVSKQELMGLVWPRLVVEENNLQVQVLALRKLLGHAAVATVPGRGYRFTVPVTVDGVEPDAAKKDAEDELPSEVRSNLPRWLPPLYGRDESLRSLVELMCRHNWVTVVGPAGVGKTRLAQAAARARLGGTQGAVWWVDLASVAEPALIPNAVSTALGQRTPTADPMAAIVATLSGPDSLLVLDNAEHLLDSVVGFVAKLRSAVSGLRLLLTSQEILHAADEHVFRVEPLALPPDATLAAAQQSGAVALFVARAQAADRHFALDELTCPLVVDICRRLDGIPLAIELAAARVPLLGIEGLQSRLDQRFQVLTSGDRTALRRHRTLQEALDWSYQLLSAPAKAVFRRLGVFAGGFTLEAAQAVAADDGIDGWDVLEYLGALVDKSLVAAVGDSAPRYHLLETMRLFALERLIEHDQVDAARIAHRDHFVSVAEAASEKMRSNRSGGLSLLDIERDNLFLALAWTRGDDDGSLGLRLALAMRLYWTSRGLIGRGLESFRSALAHAVAPAASLPRFDVEVAATTFCRLAGRLDEALGHACRSATIARELRDDARLSEALSGQGGINLQLGKPDEAERLGQEALGLARKTNELKALAQALDVLAGAHDRTGRHELAREEQEEILTLRKRMDDQGNQLVAHLNLAWTNIELGEHDAARQHLREACSLLSRTDSEFHGVMLVRIAANWAASTVRQESGVLLNAAYEAQRLRIGLGESLEPSEVIRLRQASEVLDEPARVRWERVGRECSYEDALMHAKSLLGSS